MSKKEIKRLPATFGIRLGMIAPKISKQIKAHGLKYDSVEVAKFELMREAITTLYFHGLIVESQLIKLSSKLYNKILRHVGKENCCDVRPSKPKKTRHIDEPEG